MSSSRKVRDFVEFYGKSFNVRTVCEYVNLGESSVRSILGLLISEGIIVRLCKDTYTKRLSDNVKEKRLERKLKHFGNERLRGIEQARSMREKLLKYISMLKSQLRALDTFVKEMEAL
jgi:hypothetical protein